MTARLSIVVPVLNEGAGIAATLRALARWREQGHELLVVDGGSSDDTVARCQGLADRVLLAPRGRARQMNAGAAVARHELLLFLHADTTLPGCDGGEGGADDAGAAIAAITAITAAPAWGRFDVCIVGRSRLLPCVAALMNLRSRLSGIATGDQAIFVRRALFDQLGGFADQPLMEDIELSRRLRAVSPPTCLRQRVRTSGRRWDERGAWRTIVLMWWLRWRYWRGAAPEQLALAYQ